MQHIPSKRNWDTGLIERVAVAIYEENPGDALAWNIYLAYTKINPTKHKACSQLRLISYLNIDHMFED